MRWSATKAKLGAAVVAAAIGGCAFKQAGTGGTAGTTGTGATGGMVVSDAGTPGTAGAGGSVPTIIIDASMHAGANGTSRPDMDCASVNQGAAPLPPDILILLDRSNSMLWDAPGTCQRNCGANSRWRQVTDALNMVVPMTDTTVNWGLKFFGSSGSCAVTPDPEVP